MGLVKKETFIRPNSTTTLEAAIAATNTMLNGFQEKTTNKLATPKISGTLTFNYVDYFFSDVFDARDKKLYRVFSAAAKADYQFPPEPVYYTLIDPASTPTTTNASETGGDITMIITDTGIII